MRYDRDAIRAMGIEVVEAELLGKSMDGQGTPQQGAARCGGHRFGGDGAGERGRAAGDKRDEKSSKKGAADW